MTPPRRPAFLAWTRLPSPTRLFEPFERVADAPTDRPAIVGRVLSRQVDAALSRRTLEGVRARKPTVKAASFKPGKGGPPKAVGPPTPGTVSRVIGLPRKLISVFRPAPPPPPPPARSIPFVSPVVRRVKQPLASTARMVQMAREARKPKSRWTRVRDATQQLVGGHEGTAMERVAGFGMALAGRGAEKPSVPLSRIARVLRRLPPVIVPPAKKNLRARLTGWVAGNPKSTTAKAKTRNTRTKR